MGAGDTRVVPAAAPTLQELDMDPTQRTIGEPPEQEPESAQEPAAEQGEADTPAYTEANAGAATADGTAGAEAASSSTTQENAEPPRSGPGSGKDVWMTYAESRGVQIDADANPTRDEIIAAVDASK